MKVLVYVDGPVVSPAALVVAEALRSERHADVTFLMVDAGAPCLDLPEAIEVRGLSDIWAPDAGAAAAAARAAPPLRTRSPKRWLAGAPFRVLRSAFGRAIQPLYRINWIRTGHAIASMISAKRHVGPFLRRLKPDLVITFEDNVGTFSRFLIDGAHRVGIPSIVIPFTISNPLEAARDVVTQHQDIWSRLVARCLPKWAFHFEGRTLLRLSPMRVIAMEMLGVSVPRPWILNSGTASLIALDSERARQTYLRWGFSESQLAVVGDPVGAQLYEGLSMREERRAELAIDHAFETQERPLVVCAFPTDQYHGTDNRAFEFPTYERLVAAWAEALRQMSRYANVLLRPHPRLNPKRLETLEDQGLRVTTRATADLIPAADLYVASISATIRWAIACGVPTVNYDCYRYGYGDYDDAPGVVTVASEREFREATTRFFEDPKYARDLRAQQREASASWGFVDARFPQRLASAIAGIAPGPSDLGL